VGRIGYGAMRLTGPDLWGEYPDRDGGIALLRQAVSAGVDRIDLYYLHSGRARDASFEDQVGTLAEMRKEGLIRHIGLSNVTTGQLRAARQVTEIVAVTAYFNVAARHEAALLDAAADAGAVFVPWQPVSLTRPGDPADTSGPEEFRRVLGPSPPGTGRPSRRSRWPGC
jgi:aryl-alcohol dehydrogenase-like predicted oxidoreductase